MANYIKVAPRVAEALGLTTMRNKTADGNYLLWQADVLNQPGISLAERAAAVGGVVLSPQDAKRETDGTENPVKVTVPEKYYGDADKVVDNGGVVPEVSGEIIEDKKEEAV